MKGLVGLGIGLALAVSTLPTEASAAPETTPVPRSTAVASPRPTATPTRATTPGHPATTPGHPATTPGHPATTPSHPATTPSHPATTPSHPATPPASATPDATPTRPTADTRAAATAIGAKWAGQGGAAGWLGAARTGEVCGLQSGGCFQVFAGGSIYWSPATGAHFTRGRIRDAAWGSRGWERGPLGYPTGDEFCGLRGGGCAQRFQGGLAYWSPPTDAHPVWGEVGTAYARLGWEAGPLGYPIGGEFCGLRGGGCAQRFQGGLAYWSRASGAHPVWGELGTAYARLGWEAGPLGYPIGSEFCGLRDGGCAQRFQGGLAYWSRASGAHPVWGRILDAYAAQGWENGGLRYPTGREGAVVGTTITQPFQGGKLVFHTDTFAVDNGQAAVPGLVPGNYPDGDAAPCGGSWCKNGRSMSSRGFAYRNCTDFAAFRRGMVWSQINGNGDGNAVGWRQGWIQRGRVVSNVPRVGSIAWWGTSRGGGYGHVAIVLAVNPDGSAKVEHYNFSVRGGYSVENVRAEAYLY